MTGLQFYESTDVRGKGKFLLKEKRSRVWHCAGLHFDGSSFALYDSESKYARAGRICDIPDLTTFLIARVEGGEASRIQIALPRRHISIAGRRYPRGSAASRMRDEDSRVERGAQLPAETSRAESAELPVDTWGDLATATELIATSEETPRELSDGGPGIHCLSIEEISHFAMYINDEVESAIREASKPYTKVGDGGYACVLWPGGEFTKRIRLVRHIKSAHVDSGSGKPATSKTLQLALALYNRGQVRAGVGIATGTCTPAGGYLSRSAALISGWIRDSPQEPRSEDGRGRLTSGAIINVDRHIALRLTSSGPSLRPVAYLRRADFRRVGNAYYSKCYGRLVLAKAIEPATKGRRENIRISILRHYLSVGCESAFLLPTDYRSTMQVMKDVINGPPLERSVGGAWTTLSRLGS